MKKSIIIVLLVITAWCVASPVYASGDKVRGDKGQGEVNQNDFNSQGNQN